MSGGGSSGTTTQTTNPPDYVAPYLQNAATDSTNLYNKGPNQYYQGQTVTPFSSQTQQTLDATQQRATDGSPVTDAAKGYTSDVLNGNYLNSNPYVDAQFNQAADATRGQLDTQFAGAGRNLGASQAARSDQLNNLATQIYGGNYANERAIQNSTLGQANSVANQDYTDLSHLGQVGSAYEDLNSRQNADAAARFDYNQNAPGISLDQYIARLNNQPGGSTSTPYFRNTGAGILGGAAAGAGVGSNFNGNSGGNTGTGVGALLGGLLGGYG